MIVLAIVTIVIIFLALGSAMAYFAYRDDISQRQEESMIIQNDRVREEVKLRMVSTNDEHGNIVMEVENEWGGVTEINSVMIKCDDGRIFTEPFDLVLGGGDSITLGSNVTNTNSTLVNHADKFLDVYNELGGRC